MCDSEIITEMLILNPLSICLFVGRFYGFKAKAYEPLNNPFVLIATLSAIFFEFFLALAIIPILIMHRDTPITLSFYLHESSGDMWHHSKLYWILLAFDCVWLPSLLGFFSFLTVIMLNLGAALPHLLKSLR